MESAEREPLLERVSSALAPPPMLVQSGVEKLDCPVTIPDDALFPPLTLAHARRDARRRKLPQCIAHRGYRAKYPENTLAAFRAAVKAGVHALETDLHLTKDHVVVISHDATLKRCFGRPDKILDCHWADIKDLRTLAEPHEAMPRLKDVLEYLAQPGLEDIWLLLDIKLDNDADDIMRLISTTIASVSPPNGRAWTDRIVLGIWAAKFLPLAQRYSPGFPVMNIGFSILYARHFFTVPNIGFNMLFAALVGPGGRKFLRDAQEKYHRPVLAWTVNSEDKMRWCIRRQLDGVITDDPAKFLDVCERYDEHSQESFLSLSGRDYFDVFRIWAYIFIAGWLMRKRFQPVASQELISRQASSRKGGRLKHT